MSIFMLVKLVLWTKLAILRHKFFSLLNASDQLRNSRCQKALLKFSQCSKSKVLLNTIGSQNKWGGKVFRLCDVTLHVGALGDALDTLHSLDQTVGEPGSSIGHGEGGGVSAVLGLHHLGAGILDAHGQGLEGVGVEGDGGGALGDQWHDGGASVASNNGAVHLLRVDSLESSNELVGADNVEGGNTKDLLGVVDTSLLVHLRGDGHSRVDRVGDDADHGVGAHLGRSGGKGGDDGGVGVEEIVPGHARLPWHTGRDHNDLSADKGGFKLVGSHETSNTSRSLDVGEVGSNTRGGNDVVEGQLGHSWVQLEQHRQRLTNASSSSHDSHADIVGGGGGEGAGSRLGEPGEHFEWI